MHNKVGCCKCWLHDMGRESYSDCIMLNHVDIHTQMLHRYARLHLQASEFSISGKYHLYDLSSSVLNLL